MADQLREQFFRDLDREYEALRRDPAAWAAEQAEQRLWDNTLMDGLDPDEIWTEGGDVLPSPPTPDTGRE